MTASLMPPAKAFQDDQPIGGVRATALEAGGSSRDRASAAAEMTARATINNGGRWA